MAKTTRKQATVRKPAEAEAKKQRVAKPDSSKAKEPCYFCEALVVVPDFKCQGCGEVVCDTCDELAPWGRHDVHEHCAEGGPVAWDDDDD